MTNRPAGYTMWLGITDDIDPDDFEAWAAEHGSVSAALKHAVSEVMDP